MIKTEKNIALRQTLNREKTPVRIFADLIHHPNETIKRVSACIAQKISAFSSHRIILVDILRKFEAYPTETKEIDLMLCKSRLVNLLKIKSIRRREHDSEYWQQQADRAVLRAFEHYYYITQNDSNYRSHFDKFMQKSAEAYGAAESKKQLLRAKMRIYDFGDTGPNLLRTQNHNIFVAQRSQQSGTRVAYTEFLRLLRERF